MPDPHVIPNWDAIQHEPSPDCICGPTHMRCLAGHNGAPAYWQHHAAVKHHSSMGPKTHDIYAADEKPKETP